MLIYEALKQDHRKIERLLERLTQSAEDTREARKDLIAEIRDEFIPHSRAEEAVFYNSLRLIPETEGEIGEMFGEHIEAETHLRALQAMDAIDANWTVVAKKLRSAIEAHVEKEEGEIFSAAKQVLAEEEAEMMTDAFETMKVEVRENGFMRNTLDLIANLMPARFSESMRNIAHFR
jgi:hemerythrin-like domain-containing protein